MDLTLVKIIKKEPKVRNWIKLLLKSMENMTDKPAADRKNIKKAEIRLFDLISALRFLANKGSRIIALIIIR